MNKPLGILGCGWLGLPLAVMFLEHGFTVRGTTTSPEKMGLLAAKGIVPFHVLLGETAIEGDIDGFLEGLEYLIINVPPGLRGKEKKVDYVAKMRVLREAIQKAQVPKVVFVGSTSVYGDGHTGTVTEATTPVPTTEAGRQLLESEALFQSLPTAKATIVRLAGLIGPNRHPIKQLSGRKDLKGGNAPVNLIHQRDCLGILQTILEEEHWGLTLNAVYPHHPTKKEYYTAEAQRRNMPPPHYDPKDMGPYKKVATHQPLLQTGYHFRAPIER